MILNDNNAEPELTLTFKINGLDYVIYVSTDTMKCFGCGKTWHLIHKCTQRTDSGNTGRRKAVLHPETRRRRNWALRQKVELVWTHHTPRPMT